MVISPQGISPMQVLLINGYSVNELSNYFNDTDVVYDYGDDE